MEIHHLHIEICVFCCFSITMTTNAVRPTLFKFDTKLHRIRACGKDFILSENMVGPAQCCMTVSFFLEGAEQLLF